MKESSQQIISGIQWGGIGHSRQMNMCKGTCPVTYLRTTKQFQMTETSVAQRKLVRSKTREAVRSEMAKTLSFTHKSLELSLSVAEKEYDQMCILKKAME